MNAIDSFSVIDPSFIPNLFKETDMYKVTKRMEISGSHQLDLPYPSKCNGLHGHNWIITVTLKGKSLNENGMLLDFTHIKNVVNILDHNHINDVLPAGMNSTAENMAKWIFDALTLHLQQAEKLDEQAPIVHVQKVTVRESEGNTACYTQ